MVTDVAADKATDLSGGPIRYRKPVGDRQWFQVNLYLRDSACLIEDEKIFLGL